MNQEFYVILLVFLIFFVPVLFYWYYGIPSGIKTFYPGNYLSYNAEIHSFTVSSLSTTRTTKITTQTTTYDTTSEFTTIPKETQQLGYTVSFIPDSNVYSILLGNTLLSPQSPSSLFYSGNYPLVLKGGTSYSKFISYQVSGGLRIADSQNKDTTIEVAGGGTIEINQCLSLQYCN